MSLTNIFNIFKCVFAWNIVNEDTYCLWIGQNKYKNKTTNKSVLQKLMLSITEKIVITKFVINNNPMARPGAPY